MKLQTYQDIFQSLRSFCPTDPPIVIVDKDFTEIEYLRETCPSARIILCTFHVIKYMKGVIATAHGKPFSEMSRSEITDHKEEMMQAFTTLMYSRTQNDYEIKKISWYEAIEGVEVFLVLGTRFVRPPLQFTMMYVGNLYRTCGQDTLGPCYL